MCLPFLQVLINGNYTLDITINSYSNPSNRAVRWNGGSCDGDDDNGCENQFHISTRPLLTSYRQRDKVVIPSTHTGYRDSQVRNLQVNIMSEGRWPVSSMIAIDLTHKQDHSVKPYISLVPRLSSHANTKVKETWAEKRSSVKINYAGMVSQNDCGYTLPTMVTHTMCTFMIYL